MSFDRVSRLRQLLSEAVPAEPHRSVAEVDGWRQYNAFAANTPPSIERSWRNRVIDDINRIACWYNWGADVQRHLDRAEVCSLASLHDEALEGLHSRMTQLEECVQTGCGAPDAPPAS